MEPMTSEDRLRLLRFVCSFAWADLQVAEEERRLIRDLADALGVTADESNLVSAWLKQPPQAEDIDPLDIPPHLRQAVLEAVAAVVRADGVVDDREVETFALLEALIGELEQGEA